MTDSRDPKKFGELALEKGFVTREELNRCLQIQEERDEGKHTTVRLGDIMLKEGLITEDQVDKIARHQARKSGTDRIPGYRLIKKLGDGATGVVYKARRTEDDRSVAIKVLYPSVQEDRQYLKRFFREARTVSQLHHENIIRGIDVGEHDGIYYFVMEFVDGDTLRDLLDREGPFDEEHVLDVARQVARALQHAGDIGLIHRDIKPDNILIDRDGVVKLCDLGLARKTQDEARSLTRTGTSLGTPYYMSPEQVTGKEDLDVRTDIYSLGATLYRILTGEVPFNGNTSGEIMTKHMTEDLVPPRKINPDVSRSLNRVIQKMMEKDPGDRYQTPEELLEDLEQMLSGHPPVHAGRPRSRRHRKIRGNRDGPGRKNARPSFLLNPGEGWTPKKTIAAVLVAAAGIAVILAFMQFDSAENRTAGKAVTNPVQPNRSEDPPSDPGRNPPANSSGSDEENGHGNEADPGTNTEHEKAGNRSRKWYQALEESVRTFQGDIEDVNDLQKKIDDFLVKHSYGEWGLKAEKLKKRFLEQQARNQFEKSFRPKITAALKNDRLDRAHRILDSFPNLFMKTEQWETVQTRKKEILNSIRTRFEKEDERIRRLLERGKLNEARTRLASLDDLISKEVTPDLLTRHEQLQTRLVSERKDRFRTRLTTSISKYLSFHSTFQSFLPLQNKSIFTVDFQNIEKRIGSWQREIPLTSVGNRLEGYRQDLRALKRYRDHLSEGIDRAVSSGIMYDIDPTGNAEGRLIDRDEDRLVIRLSKEATSFRSLTTIPLEERLRFAGADPEQLSDREKLARGLVGYYSENESIAETWLKRAGEAGNERASFYLRLQKTGDPARKASILIDELRAAVKEENRLKTDVLLDEAGDFWDTDLFQKHNKLVERARSLVNPNVFREDEKK